LYPAFPRNGQRPVEPASPQHGFLFLGTSSRAQYAPVYRLRTPVVWYLLETLSAATPSAAACAGVLTAPTVAGAAAALQKGVASSIASGVAMTTEPNEAAADGVGAAAAAAAAADGTGAETAATAAADGAGAAAAATFVADGAGAAAAAAAVAENLTLRGETGRQRVSPRPTRPPPHPPLASPCCAPGPPPPAGRSAPPARPPSPPACRIPRLAHTA